MNGLKEQILQMLEMDIGKYVSGENVSKQLDISRNMVWKYIGQLKSEGCVIESGRKGYRLVSKRIAISEYEIKKYLKIEDIRFEIYKCVSSTNTLLRQKAEGGAPEKTVVIATSQTEGRGRRGRSFFSPSDSGIYMSVLLRPDIKISEAVLVTTCAAVAVCRAIEKISKKRADIKWVNDIYLNGKKACGILTEAALNVESGKPEYVVLGIGINLLSPKGGFPDEIKDIAAAVFDSEKMAELYKNELIAGILNFFFEDYSYITKKPFFEEYRNRMFLRGKPVRVLSSPEYDAEVVDIDEDFCLIVRTQSGEERKLNSGEVSTCAY